MSTITTLNTTDSGAVSRVTINTNFTNLNTDKQEKGSGTTGNIVAFGASNVLQDTGKVAPSGTIVGTSDTQTLTNKVIQQINDSNNLAVLTTTTTASAVNNVNVTNNSTGNAPIVSPVGTDTNIDLAVKGKGTGSVKLGNGGLKFPNADGIANQYMKTDGSGNLSFGTIASSLPQSMSLFRFNAALALTYSDIATTFVAVSSSTITVETPTVLGLQQRNLTSDWASAAVVTTYVILGGYLYVFVRDASNNYRCYRYDYTNIGAGGSQMTFSGQTTTTTGGTDVDMFCDGTNFWFNYKAGNSANDYVLSKYTVSGTTLTYVSDVTCGAVANTLRRVILDLSGNIYGLSTSDSKVRKYNSSGTLQSTSGSGYNGSQPMCNFAGTYYSIISVTGSLYTMEKIVLI